MNLQKLIQDKRLQVCSGDDLQLAGALKKTFFARLSPEGDAVLQFIPRRCYTLEAPDLGLAQALVDHLVAQKEHCVVQVSCGGWRRHGAPDEQ